jgi:hypothetical protein
MKLLDLFILIFVCHSFLKCFICIFEEFICRATVQMIHRIRELYIVRNRKFGLNSGFTAFVKQRTPPCSTEYGGVRLHMIRLILMTLLTTLTKGKRSENQGLIFSAIHATIYVIEKSFEKFSKTFNQRGCSIVFIIEV